MTSIASPRQQPPRYQPIAGYGIIGDGHGAALVSSAGSIDWCALPHLDSPPFFLSLLDAKLGGFYQIGPVDPSEANRRYLDQTNILETTFRTATGVVRLREGFATAAHEEHADADANGRPHEILRLLECLEGSVQVELRCRVTPDFARHLAAPDIVSPTSVGWRWPGGAVRLAGTWPLAVEGNDVVGRVKLHVGERLASALADAPTADPSDAGIVRRLDAAMAFWQDWAGRCQYQGPYRQAVVRSALALKLLTYEPTGAIVAAATTSLPEEIGGERNWDYRFCWLRDATFTLYALGLLGYVDEAHDFMHWIQKVCMACGTDLQIMYGVRGDRVLTEETLDHLSGYRDSRPVRLGNAAFDQRQLDVFGEVLDSAYVFYRKLDGGVRFGEPLTGPMWGLLRSLVDYVAAHWREPDSGIWEVRGGPRHFLHSKVMCWVALDRGIRLAEDGGLPADVERWRQERDLLREEVLRRGYSSEAGAFTQSYESNALDASALLLPLVGFIDIYDPRMASTVAAIQARLTQNGLVYRYLADDGLPGGEGAFAICTFWLIDCLTFAGRTDEARVLFEMMLGHANGLGLYAEELDPTTGEFLGNFPQGFTHIALINSAVNLEKAALRDGSHNPSSAV